MVVLFRAGGVLMGVGIGFLGVRMKLRYSILLLCKGIMMWYGCGRLRVVVLAAATFIVGTFSDSVRLCVVVIETWTLAKPFGLMLMLTVARLD